MLKYQSIAADLQRSIEDGTLKPNEKLPTVVELSPTRSSPPWWSCASYTA